MGEVIALAEHRKRRKQRTGPPAGSSLRVHFHFDLACPFTYLAAERVERLIPTAVWIPTRGDVLPGREAEAVRAEAQRRSGELRLPLVWPDPPGADAAPVAMRVAAHAAEHGRGAGFALAASRLAFCGGFALDEPEVLAEAAAAAGIALEDCLAAAGDASRDEPMEAAARNVLNLGADRLPSLIVGRAVFTGEERLAEAAAAARMPA